MILRPVSRRWYSALCSSSALAALVLSGAAQAQAEGPVQSQSLGAASPAPAAPLQADASPAPATAASAQPLPAEEAGDIVVTGFRKSLASALNIKKQATGLVDAINAQDIADFPDANLADSLQRIPGISIERDGGEGRTITVRGLSGDFSRTRFNGLESIVAGTGSTLGSGINRGRSFDYSVFASELFNSIVVRKTQAAEVDEGSLGATVELQTGHPFDNPGFQAAISGQAAYYDINNTVSPRLVGLISKTWNDGRFGILLSGAYSEHKVQEDAYSDTTLADFSDVNNGFCPVVPNAPHAPVNPLVGSATFTAPCIPATGPFPGSTPAAYNTINQPGVFVPKLPGYGRFINKEQRIGLTGSIQAKFTDNTVVTIDGAFARYRQNQNDLATNPISLNRSTGVATAGLTAAQLTGRPNMKVRDAIVDANGQLVYGVFDGTDFSVTNSKNISVTTFYQGDINLQQKLGDRASLNVIAGLSESVFNNPISYLTTFSRFDGNGFVYDARGTPSRPLLTYGFDSTNPNNFQFLNGYDNIREFTNKVTNRLRSAKADFKYDLTDNLTAKVGVGVKRFDFISARQQRIASTVSVPTLASAGLTIGQVSTQPVTLTSIGLPAGANDSFIVPDVDAIIKAFNVDCYCINQYGDFRIGSVGTGAQGDNRSVRETDVSPYVEVDFKLPVAGMALRGDAGVRYAHTHQSSAGFVGSGVAVTATRDYQDWLPSLNLALDISDTLTARLAAARVMSRPSLGFLTPGGSISTVNPPFSATVGNPYLDPFRAKTIDASLEWYFAKGSILSGAYFHKKVDSFVQQLSTITTYSAAGLPLNLLTAAQDPNTTTTITSYQNTTGGNIDGFEAQLQTPFFFLPGVLQHFGIILNYTHIKSSIKYVLTTSANGATLIAPLVNVSPNAANATLYYEDDRFSIRGSLAYRDEYLRTVPLRAGLADYTGAYATKNVDVSASFKLTPHATITADAINLTNQPTSFWDGAARRDQQVYSSTGRQFFVGAKYKF